MENVNPFDENNDNKENDVNINDRSALRRYLAQHLITRLENDFFFYKRFMSVVSRVSKNDGKDASIEDTLFLIDAVLDGKDDEVEMLVGSAPSYVMNFITEVMQDDAITHADGISLKK